MRKNVKWAAILVACMLTVGSFSGCGQQGSSEMTQLTKEAAEAVEEETKLNGIKYLLVSDGQESGDCEAYILKEVSTDEEEIVYQMVEDDVEFSALAKIFSELTDDETALEY